MSIEFLDALELAINKGKKKYTCPAASGQEWHITDSLDELRPKAQHTANARRFPVNIYRIVNKSQVVAGDSYLVVRSMRVTENKSDSNISWTLVDTKEAAELVRDVSQGPTPFFGVVIEESINPIVR